MTTPTTTSPFECRNVQQLSPYMWEVTVRVATQMLERLHADWSEPVQVRAMIHGDELVPVFRSEPLSVYRR